MLANPDSGRPNANSTRENTKRIFIVPPGVLGYVIAVLKIKDGSLIDLRKYAVSLPYLALCALTEPAIISGLDFITRAASGLFLINSAATRLDSSAPAGVSNTLTVVQLSSPVSIP